MGVKVAYTSPFLQWAAHPSSSSQTLSSRAISSPSKRRHNSPFHQPSSHFLPQRLNRSSLFGTKLRRSKSCELWQSSKPTKTHLVFSANLNPFSDEEFSKKIQELTLRFHHERESMDSIEMKANSVFDLPLSLRIIKKKKKRRREEEEGGVKLSGEESSSAMSKAFSSMVFMIREIQSFTLHMREVLFYEDLRGILLRVREEMHASFVWLFQQVFSATPTLMVYVMILLANFTVYSIGGSNSALASSSAATPPMTTVTELTTEANEKFDSSVVKTFFVSSPINGNTTSVGGNNNGGGGNIRPVLNGADGDDGSEQFKTIIPEGVSSTLGSTTAESEKTSVSGQDELRLWNSIVEEAEQMQYSNTDDALLLDHETRKRFVSPLDARVEEADEEIDYFRTELLYQTGLSQEPSNPLLLANYAQFLYIVSNDYDRWKTNVW